MEVFTQTGLRLRLPEILAKIKAGAIFIHPTDTIYGIGCSALDNKAVRKVRKLKERANAPFSIWIPSLDWIKENCILTAKSKLWVEQLPGPYTLILQLRDTKVVAPAVIPNTDTIGIRYPKHWFGKIVEKLGIPIITTSANQIGQPFMTSLENLNHEIERNTEFMVYEGEKQARPSKVVHVEEEKIIER